MPTFAGLVSGSAFPFWTNQPVKADRVFELAGSMIRNASSCVFIVGNRIHPVPLPSFQQFHLEHALKEGRLASEVEEDARLLYWNHMETIRLSSTNFFPHPNYFWLRKLLADKNGRVIITTNYDCNIQSLLRRTGMRWALNPLLADWQAWDRQGYFSVAEPGDIQVWAIHGNLGFVRFSECGHVLRLPDFAVCQPSESGVMGLRDRGFACGHHMLLKDDGEFYGDPSLHQPHHSGRARHHTDYGTDRGLFMREIQGGLKAADSAVDAGAMIFIIGLTANPRYPEGEVVTWLRQAKGKRVPVLYVNSSSKELGVADSQILSVIQEFPADAPAIFINEIRPNGHYGIKHALSSLALAAGASEHELNEELETWRCSDKWYDPVR